MSFIYLHLHFKDHKTRYLILPVTLSFSSENFLMKEKYKHPPFFHKTEPGLAAKTAD